MPSLKDRLQRDLTESMRARDELRTATLRMALAAVRSAEVAGATARQLNDDEVQVVLAREVKQRREAAEAFQQGGRPELAAREQAEGRVLSEYLPPPLPEDELRRLVAQAIEETGASGPGGIGPVMRAVRPVVAGRADGARVAAEVRRQLVG